MIKATGNSGNTYVIETKDGTTLVNGRPLSIDSLVVKPGTLHWLVNGRSYNIEVLDQPGDKEYRLRVNGRTMTIGIKDSMDELLHELGMDNLSASKVNDLKAPMPGLVVDIRVTDGQQIKKGDTVIVLEAMKMENALKAVADATVKKVVAVKGAAVEKNEVLVYLS